MSDTEMICESCGRREAAPGLVVCAACALYQIPRYTYGDFVRGVVPARTGYEIIGEKPSRDRPHGRVLYRRLSDSSITDNPLSRRRLRVIDGGG